MFFGGIGVEMRGGPTTGRCGGTRSFQVASVDVQIWFFKSLCIPHEKKHKVESAIQNGFIYERHGNSDQVYASWDNDDPSLPLFV